MNKTRETSPQRSILVLFLMLVLLSVPGWAQQEASILGQVTDDTGGVLPGVTVTARSPALQVPQVIDVTNERGAGWFGVKQHVTGRVSRYVAHLEGKLTES